MLVVDPEENDSLLSMPPPLVHVSPNAGFSRPTVLIVLPHYWAAPGR